ncbi:GNAT family N-acetyltransferase [Haloechinothrix sp. YIM 98757]|uniref:GNAT family N-acetyltransferase n=1 Tax=Haloechinothrix aidingensis TaxID=2752311 RepID=A0A838AGD0_9PSEU|nr:GNAT family N-acetyltransferase [Haloechinothrix aidingensis]MBA0128158.1 GNAT family N-acetyltransferase [Haloechinothrix aidingensis]
MGTSLAEIDVRHTAVDNPEAAELLREYVTDLVRRSNGSEPTAAEVDAAQAEQPNDDLSPPDGAFLLAYTAGRAAGCVGIRRLDTHTWELKRMFVRPSGRGLGIGRALLEAAEERARESGAHTMVLDTRSDLIEARTLYAAHGYAEVSDYNSNVHADHWFAKLLT